MDRQIYTLTTKGLAILPKVVTVMLVMLAIVIMAILTIPLIMVIMKQISQIKLVKKQLKSLSKNQFLQRLQGKYRMMQLSKGQLKTESKKMLSRRKSSKSQSSESLKFQLKSNISNTTMSLLTNQSNMKPLLIDHMKQLQKFQEKLLQKNLMTNQYMQISIQIE